MIRNRYWNFGDLVRGVVVATIAVVALSGAGLASATTLMQMSLDQITRAAQRIVRARCTGNSTRWDAGEIWTFSSFEVEETWRGSTASQIFVRLLGGRVADITSTVSGVPRFRRGEEVILFLEATPRGDYSIVSWEQGTFRIRRDGSSGNEIAVQDTASFPVFDPAAREFETTGIRNLSVATLRSRVAAALRGETERRP